MKLNEATYFPDANELTRHGFVSHMEDFIGKLMGDNPLCADVDDYLKSFNIDAPKAIELLTKPEIEDVPESAVVIRTERIKNGGYDEEGKPMKDEFQVIYKVPRKDMERGIKGIDEKLRNIYIKMFENHIVEGTILEDGEGGVCGDGGDFSGNDGATNATSSGQYTAPLFGIMRRNIYTPKKKKRKSMYITEAQMKELVTILKEEEGFGGGAMTTSTIGVDGPNDWTYDVPFGTNKNDPAYDHKDIFRKSSEDGKKIKRKNK